MTGIKVFFADAYSPWQRGTNENMNRYIRQFIPKGTDFKEISHQYIRRLQNDLNNRPKKCLNYLTPNEVHFGIFINLLIDICCYRYYRITITIIIKP